MDSDDSIEGAAADVSIQNSLVSRQLKGHKECINCIDASTVDNQVFASGSDDKTVRLWDARTNRVAKCIRFEDPVGAVRFNPENVTTLFASSGNTLHTFDLRVGGLIDKSSSSIESARVEDDIGAISISSDGQVMAIADDSGVVTVVDISTGGKQPKRPKQLRGVHTSIVSAVSFHPQRSDEIVSGGFDCLVCSWDVSSGRSKSAINVSQVPVLGSVGAGAASQFVNPPFVQAVEYVCDGEGVAVALGDGTVRVMSSQLLGDELCRVEAHAGMATSLYATGNTLYSGGVDRTIRIWELAKGGASSEEAGNASKAAAVKSTGKGKKKSGAGSKGGIRSGGSDSFSSLQLTMRPLCTQQHGEKINVIAGYRGNESTTSGTLFVGDTSPNITIYTIVS